MKEVIWNGKSSKDFGLMVIGWKRPLLPEIQYHYERIPGRDGARHFRQPLGMRQIEVEFAAIFKTIEEWLAKAHEISAWLHSKEEGKLEFDDEEGVYLATVA